MHTVREYLKYRLSAKSAHGIHSPFVYDFITEVLQPDKLYYSYPVLEKWREEILQDKTSITIKDFGAGSRKFKTDKRVVGEMAKTAGLPHKYLHLFYRMVNRYNCKQILELGTSCGITTGYLSKAATSGVIHTVEGCEQTRNVAHKNLTKLKADNVKMYLGEFDGVIDELQNQNIAFDLIFIDGNHREEPTLRYFDKLLKQAHENTIFVFDDIHWSAGMTAAWNKIKQHPNVYLTFDLFKLGVVICQPKFKKQHFKLKF